MGTSTDLFDYHLPPELIAQSSVEPRDHSRLMVLDRKIGDWEHKRFYQILEELRAGDVLVMNDTKVFRARLRATVHRVSLRGASPASDEAISSQEIASVVELPRNDKHHVELFLLRPRGDAWDVLMKPGKHVRVGDTIQVGDIEGRVVGKADVLSVQFDLSDQSVIDYANVHGQIPVPPYVHEAPAYLDQYQTVYAKETGSVAAPTAGFHFTQELLNKIREKGIEIHEVTLHVGIGTFRPMKTQTIEEHEMHAEFVTVESTTAQAINRAKQEGRRVIAVGTTTVRTLEGVAAQMTTKVRTYEKTSSQLVLPVKGFSGDVNLFITPGFEFKVVDALITNFHLPKSTLLVLVSAFAGRDRILAGYEEAIRERYRFFSFGDAMLIR